MVISRKGKPISGFTIIASVDDYSDVNFAIGGAPLNKALDIGDNEITIAMSGTESVRARQFTLTEQIQTPDGNIRDGKTTRYITYKKDDPSVEESIRSMEDKQKKVCLIIDGKRVTEEEFKKVDNSIISLIEVSKDTEENIRRYGEDARDGVIYIITKDKNYRSTGNLVYFDDAAFYIHKTDNDDVIKLIIRTLAEDNIKMTCSKIERNKQGYITAISINIQDDMLKSSGSATWTTKQNIDGIPDILVGRRNNKIAVVAK